MGRDPLPASLACVDALLLPSLWSMWAELSRLGRGLQEATSCLQLQLLTSSWSPGWLVPEMLFQGSSFVKASWTPEALRSVPAATCLSGTPEHQISHVTFSILGEGFLEEQDPTCLVP